MGDNKFKWLLIVASLTCVVVTLVWKTPEAIKAGQSREKRLGEYIYVDDYTTVHASRKCSKLNYKGMKSTRNKVDDLYRYFKNTPISDISFCPNCVSDKDYEKLINSFSQQIADEADRIVATY